MAEICKTQQIRTAMETQKDGSRSHDDHTQDQRAYQNKDNSQNAGQKGDLAGEAIDHPEDMDSPVNINFDANRRKGDSLTNDESAGTDPNSVPDKPGFERNAD
jgi:hypothetical protein